MNNTNQEDLQQKFVPVVARDFIKMIVLGAVLGVVLWGLTNLLGNYVFDPLFCRNDTTNCVAVWQYSETTASVIVAILGLIGLIRLRAFRPMLIALAATASLWGLIGNVTVMTWYWALLASLLLYALAYGLFTWVVRIRVFWVALMLTVLLVVAVRYMLTS